MTINFKDYKDELIFLPLGGSNEIGMNLNCYHYQGKWLLIDCGIGFADAYYPGVDIVLPNTAFLRQQKNNILGLVLTHAHEDHVGGVGYLWDDLGCPVYATPFTAAFLKHKLTEAGLQNEVKVTEVQPGAYMQIGPFGLEMVPLTHSIPEMQAIAIRTEKGTVMHTGDWKFDEDPLVGPQSDEATLQRYGDEGVLAMVCDSTNVFVEGVAGSEAGVRENLVKLISRVENRVVVTTFASNIARLETLIQAGRQAGRQIALAGRSLWRILEAGRESGYLRDTGEMLNDKQAMDVPRNEIMIICTGCQGEPLAALSKMSRGEHHSIRLSPGDTVIFASRKIPGNEKRIGWVQNNLVERGMELITDGQEHVHVSGHPARAELKRMYELVRPRIAIPTHGETRHIHEQSRLARSLGVPQTMELRNGAVAKLSGDNPGIIGMVETGYMVVDGGTLLPADSPVIKARRRLRDEGCVVVSVSVDKRNSLAAPVQVVAPGVFDPKADEDILAACAESVADAIENLKRSDRDEAIKESVRKAVRQVIRKELDKRPLLEIMLSRV